mgnify:CR=1 FL=1
MPTLADKITSGEQLDEIVSYRPSRRMMPTLEGSSVKAPWWLNREYWRMEDRIYPESTEVINFINNMTPQYALHVSKEDPNYIAYTPDKASGEADRQLKTSLGKFLAKYYPHLDDVYIAAKVADHLGELFSNFEVVTGPAIVDSYRNAGNTGACMSKQTASYSTEGIHPTAIYDAPNISMAVLRNSDGDITARSMLYTPSETDKRYIRVYGDTKLKKMLERAGYKAGAWHGAEFKVIRKSTDIGVELVVPYLDGNGTAGGPKVSCVALIGGKLISIPENQANKLTSIYGSTAAICATSTGGSYKFAELPADCMYGRCAVTGAEVNIFKEDMVPYWKDNKVQKMTRDCIELDYIVSVHYREKSGGSVKAIYTHKDTPTFLNSHHNIVDCPEQRILAGQLKYSAKFYPDEQETWIVVDRYYPSENKYIITISKEVIKPSDAVRVISFSEENGTSLGWVHQEEITKGCIKVHSMKRGQDLWALPGVKVHKTSTGRKVVMNVHPVEMTVTGRCEFSRSLRHGALLGVIRYHYMDGEATPTVDNQLGRELFAEFMEERIIHSQMYRMLPSVTLRDGKSTYALYDGNLEFSFNDAASNHCTITWPEIMKAMTNAKVENADAVRVFNHYITMQQAEMNAVDYNGQHVATDTVDAAPVSAPAGNGVPLSELGRALEALAANTILPAYPTGTTSTVSNAWLGTTTSTTAYTAVRMVSAASTSTAVSDTIF